MIYGVRLPALVGAVLLALGTAQAEGVRSASMLANTCAGCHGTNGASAGLFMPTIGGLDKGYIYTVLGDYQTGLRPSTIMGRITKGYSDQELRVIASWFAQQPWSPNDAIADGKLVAAGGDLHQTQCETCHKDGGREQSEERPRLAGQWPGYIQYALEQCREIGARCEPRKMGERVMKLSDEQIRALAHYYASEK
jgi:cytochrome subunit of sulfide dehydrogenase